MMNARKVDEYMAQAGGYQKSWLTLAFDEATIMQGETSGGFFNDIWIPTRQYDPTTQQLAENYTYYNVGCTTAEMADIYWTEHSGNYLIGHFEDIAQSYALLQRRIAAIFKKNLGKYKKLIELEGLIWNPLWNVDGMELHQIIEQHADEVTKDTGSGESFKGQHIQDERKVTPYDSSDLKIEYQETHAGLDGNRTPSASSTIGDVTASSTAGAVPSVSESEASANSNLNVKSHESFTYSVKVEDTAFGVSLDGGDTLHTEKTVRQGNIGVTKTTELIEDARKVFRYVLLDEFFKDIDEVILVGIYGDYMSSGEKFYHHFVESQAEIDHVEIDKYGHIVKVAMKGESTEITPNQIIFGNRLSGQT